MPDTPLNPDALDMRAYDEALLAFKKETPLYPGQAVALKDAVMAYAKHLALAKPEVTGEQVNLAGWTCNGIHEPGDYSTCEECRDACDDLANFYNHMVQNPRQFKHWTGTPEVNDGR